MTGFTPPPAREFSLTRRFAAPRALVWRAWTDPLQLAQWWGPQSFTNPVCEVDLRVGGIARIVMRSPEGMEFPMRMEFREIVAPERLVFGNYAVDAEDRPLIDGLTTVTLSEVAGGTELHVHTRATALVPIAVAWIGGMDQGWTQSIESLAAFLSR